ncbi:endonuclease/exonuclease/phosphatase family protein [Streptomyces sp. ODS05-4]|uniref:endonuclease/exonuclease/phosphatase family protein n=1 Tax=Streptomyces sp. ODS05-4 TaxID=2944939 RepID=UPI00210A9517|nr:endonuclease/exonuclease/phosphatase family protein [Streptomyces sp. ODS05-4]
MDRTPARTALAAATALATLTAVMLMPSAAAAPAAPAAAGRLTVMSFNTWHGGGQVADGFTKTVDAIRGSGADVVALQESNGDVARRIADRLGWYTTATGTHVDIVSRFPIEQEDWTGTGNGVVAARIKGFWIYSTHFDYTKYGPYNACWDDDSYAAIHADEANRAKQAEETVKWAGSGPAIMAGDFNSPSHLDWTEDTRAAHCASVVQWPTTKAFGDAGYRDSFRELHPDEAAVPGDTWSPVVKSTGGRKEPQDRIDFILYKGSTLKAVGSRTVGGGRDWPSDHLAVLTTFTY